MDIDWLKDAGEKTLDEFREAEELRREDIDGWKVVSVYCPECELSFDEPVDIKRMGKIAKSRGVSELRFQTKCAHCSLPVEKIVREAKWAEYAIKGPAKPWVRWGRVAVGALVAAGFGVYWQQTRKKKSLGQSGENDD